MLVHASRDTRSFHLEQMADVGGTRAGVYSAEGRWKEEA